MIRDIPIHNHSHSLYVRCLSCKMFGINTPTRFMDASECGSCGSMETVKYYPSCCIMSDRNEFGNQLADSLANEQASATAYAEVKAELAKVKMECSGMGKVLSSGVVISTEEYSALVAAQKELEVARERVKELEANREWIRKWKPFLHECSEWDGLVIDKGDKEFECCSCFAGAEINKTKTRCSVLHADGICTHFGAEPKSRG